MSTASSTRIKVLVLAGPTASGKTELLLKAFAGKGPEQTIAVVVSADSMQAYRGMDIGTAKPGPDLLSRLPHRLIDIREPSEQYTAGDFVHLADEACEAISSEGLLPVVSGGTGFYIRNFMCGLPGAPPADPERRAAVALDLAERGSAALREELRAIDPASAERIHPNDHYRLTRALEIVRATGRPMADFASAAGPRKDRDFLVLGLERPREELNARIDARVEAMFATGLPEEVERLRAKGYGPECPGMQAIGYREFFEPGLSRFPMRADDILAVKELVKRNSRRYAKRQMTFFRALPGIMWIEPEAGTLAAMVESFLADGADFGL